MGACNRRLAAILGVVVYAALPSSQAQAFEVGTAISDDCHERMTLEAFRERLDDFELEAFDLPSAGPWETVTQYVAQRYGFEDLEPWEQYVAMSLFAGVRSVDTGGRPAMNVEAVRLFHGPIENMHSHCTRNPEDDGEVDDEVLAGCREVIAMRFRDSENYLRSASPHQRVTIHLDFYGTIELNVWGPGYQLGRAVHTLQDSFSHSIRNEELNEVFLVMNFIDAIDKGYEETRDGFRHSNEMDRCNVASTEKLVATAVEATQDAMLVASSIWYGREGRSLQDDVFDPWMTYVPGCLGPGYCDSPWVLVAQKDLTEPYLGCAVARPKLPSWPSAVGVWGLVLFVICRRKLTRSLKTQ